MTEDDTFKVLAKLDYHQMNRIWCEWLASPFMADKDYTTTHEFFRRYGWTTQDFFIERFRRT